MDKQWNLRNLYLELLDSMIKAKQNVKWDENVEICLTQNDDFMIRVLSRTGDYLVSDHMNKEEMIEWFEKSDYEKIEGLKLEGA